MSRLSRWLLGHDVTPIGHDLQPIVDSSSPAGATLAAAARADMEQNAPAELRDGWRRFNVPDGGTVEIAAGVSDEAAAKLRDVMVAFAHGYRSRKRAPQDVRKAYGRASRTIHVQRGELALLREEIAELQATLADERNVNNELHLALDYERPAPDPAELGQRLKAEWMRPRVAAQLEWGYDQRWAAVAEVAIDAVRGLRPFEAPGGDMASAGKSSGAALGPAPDGEPLVETSPGGGDESRRAPVAPTGEAPAPDGSIRDHSGRWWRCTALDIAHRPGTPGERVHCSECRPDDDLNGATSTNDVLAAAADEHREQLAQVLARRDLELGTGTWESWNDRLRDYYRAGADDVINAGWRPPLATRASAQLPVVARLLVDHEQLADGTCRCGWGVPVGDLESGTVVVVWHAEHVAEQLLATGAITR